VKGGSFASYSQKRLLHTDGLASHPALKSIPQIVALKASDFLQYNFN
jgi:hypothetical protein